MYSRKLCVNLSKYFLREMKLKHTILNHHRLISRKMFANYPSRALEFSSRPCHRNTEYYRGTHCNFMLSAGLLYSLFDFWKNKEEEDIPELIMSLKRSVLLIQRGEYKKAERMLHVALNQAQTLQNYDGITYIYDLLANIAFDTEDYKKAEKLFLAVLQRLISSGTPQNDLKVIHISLKIAKIFERTNFGDKAEQGYIFCIEELRSQIEKSEGQNNNEDAIELLGMTLDWYARMLFSQAKYTEALKYFSEAYDICVKVNGETYEQSVILLNDLGTVYYMMGQYDIAFEHLSKAVKIGTTLTDLIEFGSIHVNLGNVFLKKGMIDQARKACEKGQRIAKARQDENTIVEATKCLNKINEYLSSVKK